jgi:hypothetical protein
VTESSVADATVDPSSGVRPLMKSSSAGSFPVEFAWASTLTAPPATIVVPLPMYACTVGFDVAVDSGAPTVMPSAPLKLLAVASASASSTIAVTLTSWPRPSARTILAFEPM